MLTIVADYRLYPEVRYPEFLNDRAAALAWGLETQSALAAIRIGSSSWGTAPAATTPPRSPPIRAGSP